MKSKLAGVTSIVMSELSSRGGPSLASLSVFVLRMVHIARSTIANRDKDS